MKVVFLIGNGFDLHQGLKTSYKDFYDYYLDVECDKPQVIKLKEHLQRELPLGYWSDLEIAMGRYTESFDSLDELKEAYYDINDELQKYIAAVENEVSLSEYNRDKLIKDLSRPDMYLREGFKQELHTFYKNWQNYSFETSIISFNYTDTIERILKYKAGNGFGLNSTIFNNGNSLRSIIHIHGKTTDEILLGLNDKEQISNVKLREDIDAQDCLLKPLINKAQAHNLDIRAKKYIQEANVICLFGVSLGETDNIWWETVGESLKKNCRVIYFIYTTEKIRATELNNTRRIYKNKLLERTKLTEEEKKAAFDKIFIVRDEKMFKLK